MIVSSTYKDSPDYIEKAVAHHSESEQQAFDLGYLAAMTGVVEQLIDTKNRLLTKCLELDGSEEDREGRRKQADHKKQLLSRVHILDVLEKHFNRRIEILEPKPEQV